MKVTVAIPVYNAERHLNVTLDSLVNQTMDPNDFEVICVNDKSNDNSVEVIKSYMKNYSNIKLINRDTNAGGPMIPRNDAIEAARGEYILFLDNDDFLGEETLERFFTAASTHKSDVIYGKYIGVNGRVVPQSMFKFGNLPNADIIEHNLVFSLAPHKMFRLSLIREHQIRFHPEAVIGEDQLFVMDCYVRAKVITVLADYNYYYVVKRGEENLSVKYFPAKNFYYSFTNIMKNIEESNLHPLYKKQLKAAFLNRFFQASRLRGYILTRLPSISQKEEWLNETKKFIDEYIDDELLYMLPSKYHYFILAARDNDLQKLLLLHKQMESVNANDVTRVEDGWIYAKFRLLQKQQAYEEEHTVNHLNDSDIFVDEILITDKQCQIRGQFYQSLLINMDVKNELVLVHRNSGLEKRIKENRADKTGEFNFSIDFREFVLNEKLVGPWDVFIEGTINGYKKRRRLGQARNGNLLQTKPTAEKKTILNILDRRTEPKVQTASKKEITVKVTSFGKKYKVKVYFTQNFDNLSFDVKLNN
ncbi:glycosyltransferase [Lederbergia wuyishanensis]|uniref:Glycosyltransferase involved in cell wall biosynthesis n=1 Tax=Lederbergia wuyishanensis TaxID=1347903 RepID=A0ABU0D3A7_9BACI|nr:glycosyltransferase [Lederbergia wuyishanensis]MCJ8007977.1 glycosyltransferase [Lederbergia wuyishanensis]MDQ0342853.1 glycosyltransferase involved in cell wall biosynthesis [Lederbergia wuyishanensis]